MPKLGKRANALKQFNKQRKDSAQMTITSVTRFVFSTFVFGLEFTNAAGFMLLNDVKPPSQSAFYKAEHEVVDVLLEMANEDVNKNLEALKEGAIITLDGSWRTKRNSRTFILDAIDVITKKIIAFVLIDKDDKNNPYDGSSNMMEAAAFRKMIPKLMASGKISAIVKDGDTKLAGIAKEFGWDVTFLQDPQHLKKNFGTLFTKYNKIAGGKLKGYKQKIINHINYVLYSEKTPDEKREMFLNIIQHFTGNHANCNHDDESIKHVKELKGDKQVAAFVDLVKETATLFGDFDPKLTTNYNENFHSVKARYLSKNLNIGYSWKGRIAAAILQYNDKYNWIGRACQRLHLPSISLPCLHAFIKLINHSLQRMAHNKAKRNTKEAKNNRREKQIAAIKLEQTNNPEAHK